ncbi:MAG TPA: hypothetical protein VEK57_28730 [Thermoanaerobaculia bacterium]|nr:hypothetical protein [Thermoanaerobaculia bacterium]
MKKILIATLVLFTVAAAAQEKSKPVDVAVKQVNDRRTNGHFAQLAISLELPKVPTLEVAASRVLISRAVDETGRDLLDPEAQEPELETNHRAGLGGKADPSTPVTVSVTLKNPDRKATKVKEVRGEIELFMPGKDASSVAEIPKFLSLAGKPLTHKALKANGVEIALLTTAQVEAEKKKRADAKKKEYAEMGFAGEDLENMIKSFMESLLGVQESELLARVKDPKGRIQEISYVDAAGDVKPVMMRDEEGMTLLSTWAGKPEPDWKMRISMKTSKNVVRYAFALNDVALP